MYYDLSKRIVNDVRLSGAPPVGCVAIRNDLPVNVQHSINHSHHQLCNLTHNTGAYIVKYMY